MLSFALPAANFSLVGAGGDDLSLSAAFESNLRADPSWTVSRSTVALLLLWVELEEGGSGCDLELLVGVVSFRVGVASLANIVDGGCGDTDDTELDKPVKPVTSPS